MFVIRTLEGCFHSVGNVICSYYEHCVLGEGCGWTELAVVAVAEDAVDEGEQEGAGGYDEE